MFALASAVASIAFEEGISINLKIYLFTFFLNKRELMIMIVSYDIYIKVETHWVSNVYTPVVPVVQTRGDEMI